MCDVLNRIRQVKNYVFAGTVDVAADIKGADPPTSAKERVLDLRTMVSESTM